MTFADRMYMCRIWLRIAREYEKSVRLDAKARRLMATDARRLAASCFTNPAPNFLNFEAE